MPALATMPEQKKVTISSKRQFTIPQKFYTELGFDREAVCTLGNGMLIIEPARSENGGEFAEQILTEKDPIASFKLRMNSTLLNQTEIKNYQLYFKWIVDKCKMQEASTIKDELLNTCLLLETLIKVHELYNSFINKQNVDLLFKEITDAFSQYKKEHQRLWNLRNKEDGYYASVERIIQLENVLSNLKKEAINYE